MEIRMTYRQFKTSYADCETKPGTYDKNTKSIVVIIPDGRMKPSGVRGRHFIGYQLWLINEKGEYKYCTYRATCIENAEKQHRKWCAKNNWTPIEPPEGEIARIYT